jgi:glycosyltransferase involved in cell wall biosynthesis
MTPRRVAYVVGRFPKLSETFVVGELAELRRRGVDVRVLSLKHPDDEICHDAVHSSGLLERTTYDAVRFREVLDAFRPELVHAHFATEPTAEAMAIAATRRVPFTFTAHGYDVYRKAPPDFAARAAAAAAVVTVSDANRRHLTATLGVREGAVRVIPCGVDTEWFSPGTPDLEPPLVVCVARMNEVKRLDVLLRACAAARDLGLRFGCVVVGDGPERPRLESLRSELNLESVVQLPGAAEQAEVRRWWRRATVAVLSSRSEGMPVCLMEAAGCGVPAVAPAVGGIPELIEDGVTGIVTPPSDPNALADGLVTILSNDVRRRTMGAAARRRAQLRFSRAAQVDRLLELWSGIIH